MRTPRRHIANDGYESWNVPFREGTSAKTGKPKQRSKTFNTYNEAARFAALIQHMSADDALTQMDLETGRATVPTLDDIAADHIEYLTGIEDGTRLNYTRLWDRTWHPIVGHLPANQVTRDRLAAAVNQLARHYSAKSLKNQRGLLAAVCERAVDKGHLKTNPAKGLRLPRAKETERTEMRILTDDELTRLVEHTHDHYRPLVQFLASTGCRWGEAVALTVADVEDTRGQARIRRSLKWSPDNNRVIGATKTRRSNRAVPLVPEMLAALRSVTAGKARTDLVFTAPRGGPVHHRTFWSDVWLPAVQKANLGEPRPRIHDLRHSYAGRLLGAGVPIHVVQRLLGHESIQTTVDTYGGLLPDALSQAVAAAAIGFTQTRRPAELPAGSPRADQG